MARTLVSSHRRAPTLLPHQMFSSSRGWSATSLRSAWSFCFVFLANWLWSGHNSVPWCSVCRMYSAEPQPSSALVSFYFITFNHIHTQQYLLNPRLWAKQVWPKQSLAPGACILRAHLIADGGTEAAASQEARHRVYAAHCLLGCWVYPVFLITGRLLGVPISLLPAGLLLMHSHPQAPALTSCLLPLVPLFRGAPWSLVSRSLLSLPFSLTQLDSRVPST